MYARFHNPKVSLTIGYYEPLETDPIFGSVRFTFRLIIGSSLLSGALGHRGASGETKLFPPQTIIDGQLPEFDRRQGSKLQPYDPKSKG
jgi:hypothetical protein